MAKIAVVRVDYRMVHGQVASSVVKSSNANTVVVMNDEASTDKTQISIMKLSVGADTKLKVVPVEKGVDEYKENKFGKGTAVVIFREVEDAYKAFKAGFEFSKLNIGQVPMIEGRRYCVGTINLSDQEMDLLQELVDNGVEVFNHPTIHDSRYDWNDMKKAMGR